MKYTRNAELNLVRSVLDNENFEGSLFRGVKGEYFVDKKIGAVWNYILLHWSDYGKIPAHDTIFEEYPELVTDLIRVNPQEPSDFYAVAILNAYSQRGFVKDLMDILPNIENNVEGTLENVRKTVAKYDIIRDGIDVFDLHNTRRERYNEYTRQQVHGIKFGWPSLDNQTLGMHGGQLIGFVARGGQGKSWSLLFNALEAWTAGYKTLMVGTELPALDMLKRVDALHMGVNYNMFKKQNLTNVEFDKYKDFLFNSEEETSKRFQIINGFGVTPSALNVLIEHHKPDVVFIDGVYLLESDAHYSPGNDWQKVRFLANELKHKVARANDIPVAFNTQFSRSVGTAVGKSKKVQGGVEDIGYGDEFGKAADLLVSIYRDEQDVLDRLLTMQVIKGREIEDGLHWKVKFNFEQLSFKEHVQAEEFFGGVDDDDDDNDEDFIPSQKWGRRGRE